MSFHLRELARWFGEPVQLYRFARQDLLWLYTSGDVPITVGDETYEPLAIARTSIRESSERQKRQIKITLPNSADVCNNWRPFPPGDVVAVTLLALQRGDAEVQVEWYGRVIQPKFGDKECELTCDPSSGSARPYGLQLRWQRGCPYALYSQGHGLCNLNPEDFAVPATLTAVSGLTLTAEEFAEVPAGRFAGGYIEWLSTSGLVHRRSIMSNSGSTLVVDYGAEDLASGLDVVAYHGCAHNWADCDSKGNSDNYGGCTKSPSKNPFGGIPIWW